VRRAAAEGHEIGNHSFAHRHPWLISARTAREEVRNGSAVLSEVLGRAPRFFRPPHGRMRACMNDEAQRSGQATVLWDLSAIDWGPLGRAPRIARRLASIEASDIVLMHDGRNEHNRPDELLQVLPALLVSLRERGLCSVALL
jgi:peptidoglycan/xylan/chitin deacetylase (PgdA/CDA1 family)